MLLRFPDMHTIRTDAGHLGASRRRPCATTCQPAKEGAAGVLLLELDSRMKLASESVAGDALEEDCIA